MRDGFFLFVVVLCFLFFVYCLPLQCRHSEERGVSLRPKSWFGQRFGYFLFVVILLFTVWLLPPHAGWFFFVYGYPLFIVYCLPLQSRHSEERGVSLRSTSWLGQRFRFFFSGFSIYYLLGNLPIAPLEPVCR
jgi:hypothetical protein